MKRLIQNSAVPTALLIIFIGSALLDYFLPAMGDDLSFWYFLGLEDYTVPNRKTISFILAHIFGCNGRIFDYMGPVVINLLPRVMAAIVMGGMAGLFFFSILFASRIPHRRHTAFSIVILTVTLAVIPWWDGMYLRVCQFNYSWGTTFCLLFIALFFANRNKPDSKTTLCLLGILGIFAGGAHEQTGVAMSAAFILWALPRRRFLTLSARQKVMIIALFFGTFLTIAAPSIWHRAAAGSVRQTLGLLITTTVPVYLLLLLITGICMCTRRGRTFIYGMAATQWIIYVAAGFFAGVIAILSGIPGRTGFFTEACAIVALARMALACNSSIKRPIAAIISILCIGIIAAHFTTSIYWQKKMYREFMDVKAEYAASPDGIVFYDFTNRYDVSPLTLNRVKGVADADDVWFLLTLRTAYRPDGNIPVVLPTTMRGFTENLADSVSDGSTTVYTKRPAHVVLTQDSLPLQYYPGPSPRFITKTTLTDGRDIWVATPRVRDPGDYELSVISKE